MLIDAHNHLQDPRFEGCVDDLILQMQRVGIAKCVVNGTGADDWPRVARLAESWPDFVLPSFGLHPWKVTNRDVNWRDKLHGYLMRFSTAGVGECGLDRWIKDHDVEDQKTVFATQLQLAAELNRPCSVHCLKAWKVLLDVLNECEAVPRMLMHSYSGSKEVAKELSRFGVYFSFSGYFLHPRKANVIEVFRTLPANRILVETDAPDMMPPSSDRQFGGADINHPANLSHIQTRLSELVGIEQQKLVDNTLRWLGGEVQ